MDVVNWENETEIIPDRNSCVNGGLNTSDLDLEADGWDIEEDFEIPLEETQKTAIDISLPNSGLSASDHWIRNSALAVDHAAAGSFETAMQVCLNNELISSC